MQPRPTKSQETIDPATIQPVNYTCLIKLEPIPEQKSSGGIHLPDSYQERHQFAQTTATLIRPGGNAFEDFAGVKPQSGDRVMVRKYAGEPPKAGQFEDLHRLCTDKDIIAVLLPETEASARAA